MLLTDLAEDTLAHILHHADLESARRCALAHPRLRSVAYLRCLNDEEVQRNKVVMEHMRFRTTDALAYRMTIRNRDKSMKSTYRPYVCGTCGEIVKAIGSCCTRQPVSRRKQRRIPAFTSPLLLFFAMCLDLLQITSYFFLDVGTGK